jgi:heme/copper-type cytochrome/quinol oxidase subunit 1
LVSNPFVAAYPLDHLCGDYCVLGVLMLIRGFADAIMMRTQQAVAINSKGYLPPEHYDQIFTAHGTIMILFGAMRVAHCWSTYLFSLASSRARAGCLIHL